MKTRLLSSTLIIFLFTTCVGCRKASLEHHSVLKEKLDQLTWDSPQDLGPLQGVVPLKNKLAVSDAKNGDFFTETRSDKLVQKNCLNCHKDGRLEAVGGKEADSHWDLQKIFKHASPQVMSCTTCHNSTDITQLKMLNGEKLAMDKSFQVCAQCHFKQEQDWRLGAHGKRLGSWRGERTIKNCASCHNPHKPAFEKRWPKTFNKNLMHFSEAAKK
jgi:hypothetical protein